MKMEDIEEETVENVLNWSVDETRRSNQSRNRYRKRKKKITQEEEIVSCVKWIK